MPTLSNGSALTVWEEPDNPNPSPAAILFSITETDGDLIGPIGAKEDYVFGSVDLASVDVFDGFFTVTSFTNEGRIQTATTIETQVFDNQGNLIRTISDKAAYLSAKIVSVTATSPDDITVTWIGANEYFGGENTQYGPHQIILAGGAIQPDTFINHAPSVADLDLTLSQGEAFIDVRFKATDADYDLLSFVVLDGPDHGTFEQQTSFDGNHYPFYQGHYGTLHYHMDFLSGNLFDYTPESGFVGTDSFTVYATDGQGNSNVATITITVTPPAESVTLTNARNIVSYTANDHAVVVAALDGDDRVNGTPYNDTIEGGAGHDQLFGSAGADHIFGGAGTDWLKGGAGYDEIVGGAGTDGIRGDAGDDLLDGGADSDDMRGGDGDDVINGGAGRDHLVGGAGRDTFLFNAAPGPANDDSIADFNALDDVIRLHGSVFSGLSSGPLSIAVFVIGTHALDDSDHVIYDKVAGELLFDVDGAGGAAALRFASVTPGTTLTVDDFVVG